MSFTKKTKINNLAESKNLLKTKTHLHLLFLSFLLLIPFRKVDIRCRVVILTICSLKFDHFPLRGALDKTFPATAWKWLPAPIHRTPYMGACQVIFQIYLTVQSYTRELTNRTTARSVCSVLIPQYLVSSSLIGRLTWFDTIRDVEVWRFTSGNILFAFENFLLFS